MKPDITHFCNLISLPFKEYIMSENRAIKGGDRKSIKYIGSKNDSFLTDFFPKKNGKNPLIRKRSDRISGCN